MAKKIYFLTELESEIIEQRRKFNEEILAFSIQEQLERNKKNDNFILNLAKEKFQKGENIIISESCRNNFSLIEKLIYFFRKK